jgi:diguanylate cyclase (GGDEF)-like protein/PAS domain S-box-containing protein
MNDRASAADPFADAEQAAVAAVVDAIDLPLGRWDRAARLVFCNHPYERWAGRPRAALLGRTLEALYGSEAWAAARAAFAAAFDGRSTRYERLLTHRDAPVRWARVQVFPCTGAAGHVDTVFTIAFDIHDDVEAREALEATRRRLDRFTENIPYPLTYVDTDFVLRFVNKAYCEIVGQPSSALVGRPIGDVRGAARWAQHRPYFERARAGETVQYTREVENRPGEWRWVRTTYTPDRDPDGTVVGVYTSTIDVHDLTIAQQRLQRRAERDALTDLFTRRAMMERLDAAVGVPDAASTALYFIDLDGFKQVNDALGHGGGDALLVAVARALQGAVRARDAVGRFGGDEFLVLAEVSDAQGAQTLALHLLAAIDAACAGSPGQVGASIGYALSPADAGEPLRLLQRADEAMYAAKRSGKRRAVHCAAAGRAG